VSVWSVVVDGTMKTGLTLAGALVLRLAEVAPRAADHLAHVFDDELLGLDGVDSEQAPRVHAATPQLQLVPPPADKGHAFLHVLA